MRLIFTRFPLESALGGAELQTLALAEGLADRGHEIVFAGSCPVLLHECKERGWQTEFVEIGPPPVSKGRVVSFLWRRNAMREHLDALAHDLRIGGGDAVFMLSLSEKLLMTSAWKREGTAVLWIEHDRIGPWLTHNPWLSLLKKQSRSATIVTVSDLSKRHYEKIGFDPKRITAIPNGIDTDRWGKGKRMNKNAIPYDVGCVARLSPEKGVDVLIAAMAGIPEANLTLIGAGNEEGYLRSLAAQYGMTERMTIIPHTDDLGRFYRSCDLFVLPSSDHDPFGLVAGEAMACGTPTIVTAACGIAGYFRDDEALIVPAADADALRAAITQVLHNEKMRSTMEKGGKEAMNRLFSMEAMIDGYMQLLPKK